MKKPVTYEYRQPENIASLLLLVVLSAAVSFVVINAFFTHQILQAVPFSGALLLLGFELRCYGGLVLRERWTLGDEEITYVPSYGGPEITLRYDEVETLRCKYSFWSKRYIHVIYAGGEIRMNPFARGLSPDQPALLVRLEKELEARGKRLRHR